MGAISQGTMKWKTYKTYLCRILAWNMSLLLASAARSFTRFTISGNRVYLLLKKMVTHACECNYTHYFSLWHCTYIHTLHVVFLKKHCRRPSPATNWFRLSSLFYMFSETYPVAHAQLYLNAWAPICQWKIKVTTTV